MKALFIALAVVSAVMISTSLINKKSTETNRFLSSSSVPLHVQQAWTLWKMEHGRTYGTSTDEKARLANFHKNYNYITAKNAEKRLYTVGLNKFSDMSTEEFSAKYLSLQAPVYNKSPKSLSHVKAMDSVDWTEENAVSPVKDQGECGSCWAFSTTGALEGLTAIKENYLFYFSEQQLVDCAGGQYRNMGCHGGLMANAFNYTADKGITQEADYAYTAQDGTCNKEKEGTARVVNHGHESVAIDDNDALMAAITQQPVSVGIEADAIMSYRSGIFDDWTNCGTQLNHGVLAVGYGADGDNLYYKVKNSWGYSWGESGYFRLQRRTGSGVGMCGITRGAVYPTV